MASKAGIDHDDPTLNHPIVRVLFDEPEVAYNLAGVVDADQRIYRAASQPLPQFVGQVDPFACICVAVAAVNTSSQTLGIRGLEWADGDRMVVTDRLVSQLRLLGQMAQRLDRSRKLNLKGISPVATMLDSQVMVVVLVEKQSDWLVMRKPEAIDGEGQTLIFEPDADLVVGFGDNQGEIGIIRNIEVLFDDIARQRSHGLFDLALLSLTKSSNAGSAAGDASCQVCRCRTIVNVDPQQFFLVFVLRRIHDEPLFG
jgi:hypothetical protein|tara:strand:+ start:186 stop:953 length:768 start_codon:yes stop_codon:yes gene_type:complete